MKIQSELDRDIQNNNQLEPEFTPHIKTIVENSVSTYETAARNAKANGALYGRIFTCTPRQHRAWISVMIFRKTLLIAGNSFIRQSAAKPHRGTFNDYPLRSTSKRMEIQCPYIIG